MTDGKFADVAACVFDAYGTLFDVNSAGEKCRDRLGDKLDKLNEVWRFKQLQYTWLRSLMGKHVDFWEVTSDALDYTMEALDIQDDALRAELMQMYLSLDAYPEVADTLKRLKDGGMKTAILSNGSPTMLVSAVKTAGLNDVIDEILSIEDAGVFKPDPRTYQLACDKFKVEPGQISFQSSNAWDAAGAATFGFQVAWINRFGQPQEKLPGDPGVQLASLSELPAVVGL